MKLKFRQLAAFIYAMYSLIYIGFLVIISVQWASLEIKTNIILEKLQRIPKWRSVYSIQENKTRNLLQKCHELRVCVGRCMCIYEACLSCAKLSTTSSTTPFYLTSNNAYAFSMQKDILGDIKVNWTIQNTIPKNNFWSCKLKCKFACLTQLVLPFLLYCNIKFKYIRMWYFSANFEVNLYRNKKK